MNDAMPKRNGQIQVAQLAADAQVPRAEVVLLTPIAAAVLLGISPNTLANWRSTGQGPPFVKVGPKIVRYRRDVLLEWAGLGAVPQLG
jgi:Helix-turn-helix domain